VIENSTIVDVVKRLKSAGIFVKGYFILGGPGQSKSDIEDTIAFATHANLDLAYFAIYKEFRDISLRAQRERSDEQASLKFGLFAPKIFDTIADPENADSWLEVFGIVPPLEERKGFAETMSDLKLAGFSFEDLIRYNDYHEWEEPYLRMGFAGRHEYLHCLARAYLAFYGRQEWVKCYRALRASGY
jgi:hypothetical protein